MPRSSCHSATVLHLDRSRTPRGQCDVYVGEEVITTRGVKIPASNWCNPFRSAALIRDRRDVLYEKYLIHAIGTDRLCTLEGKALGCYCNAHNGCDAEVLARVVREKSELALHKPPLGVEFESDPLRVYFGRGHVFSIFHTATLLEGTNTFIGMGHIYAWKKALALGETYMAREILTSVDSQIDVERYLKYLSDQSPEFPTVEAVAIMWEVLCLAWEQWELLRRERFDYQECVIVQASRDAFWGSGHCGWTTKRTFNGSEKLTEPPLWENGANIMGLLLMYLPFCTASSGISTAPLEMLRVDGGTPDALAAGNALVLEVLRERLHLPVQTTPEAEDGEEDEDVLSLDKWKNTKEFQQRVKTARYRTKSKLRWLSLYEKMMMGKKIDVTCPTTVRQMLAVAARAGRRKTAGMRSSI